MKTIASLTGPDFLRACNRTRHAVYDFMAATNLLKLREVQPVYPEGASEEEKEDLRIQQSKKNISAMLDRALEENPEETYKLLCTMAIPEKKTKEEPVLDENGNAVMVGNLPLTHTVELDEYEELDGFDLLDAALELIGSEKVLDFFTKLVKSVLSIMDA